MGNGYTYEMKLLNVGDNGYLKRSEDAENPSGNKEDVNSFNFIVCMDFAGNPVR